MNFPHAPATRRSAGRPRTLISAVLLAALTGCSLWNGGAAKPEPVDLGPNVAVLGVKQAWTAQLGNVTGPDLDIRPAGNVVVIASSAGIVAAIDARTGRDMWRTSLPETLSAGVGSDGKSAAVVSSNNVLIVLEEGREQWRQSLGSQVFTPPLVAGGRVFVLAADRSVTAFDGASGRKLWHQQRQGEPLVLRQDGVLLAVGDTLVTGFAGRLVGLNPDNGSVRWEAPIGSSRGSNDVERLVELVGRTSRVGDSVCARAFQAAVGCVDTARGNTLWTQPAYGSDGIHGDADAIFGTESNGTVIAWRRSDGSRLWTTDRLKYRKLTAPLLLGRSVVVGDRSGLVHLLSRADGAPLNRLVTDGSGIAGAPVVAGGTLVVVTQKGGVFGFRPE